MAEYFHTRSQAEAFIKEWHTKNGSTPAFFAKIINHGEEKWIVSYDARQNPAASPHIKILANHSSEIRSLLTKPAAQPAPASDEQYLASPPLSAARRRLLWTDPSMVGAFASADVYIQEANHVIQARYTPEDVEWAKQVNVFALKAEEAGRADKHETAISLYKQALELAPGCDLYLMSIGCSYANMGQLALGLRYLERAHEISPTEDRIARNLLGVRQALQSSRAGLDGRG